MSFRKNSGLVVGSVVTVLIAFAALGCYQNDDTDLTARTQSHVNQVLNATSEIQVNASDSIVTLTGLASSDEMHARAVAAARSVAGVRGIVDHISTPVSLTGGKVPK